MAVYANWGNVSLSLHGDGANNGTVFTDSSPRPKTATAFGNAKTVTDAAAFGGSAISLGGVGDYLRFADHADFELGGGDFTIAGFITLTAYAVNNLGSYAASLVAKDISAGRGYGVFVTGTASSYTTLLFVGYSSNSVSTTVSAAYSFALNTRYHIKIVRRGNSVYLFVDGTLLNAGGTAFSVVIQDTATPLLVGSARYDANYLSDFPGRIDDFYLVKGIAESTANFSVPTEAFPDEGQYIVGAIPMMSLEAGFGISADLAIPMIQADQNLLVTADLTIPMMTLDAGFGASVDLTIPMMRLSAAGHDSTGENSFHGVIPMMTLEADFGASVDAVLPMMVLDASMTGTALISVELAIPMMTLDAQGTGSPYSVTADLRIPMMTLDADFGASVEVNLPMMTLEASLTAGGLLTADLRIPMMTLDAHGTQQTYGWADLTIPMMVPLAGITADLAIPMMLMDASITAVVTVTYEAYSINLSHRDPEANDEVTRYTNFPFDRIVRYQNSYFGVAADGLYLLEGTTDDGAAIPYAVKTCIDDFKAPELKTVASAYFGGRLGPGATVTLHAGEQGQESYAYNTPRGQGAQNHREKFGRGVKNRYFALGLAGEDTLELDNIELEINKLTRRI